MRALAIQRRKVCAGLQRLQPSVYTALMDMQIMFLARENTVLSVQVMDIMSLKRCPMENQLKNRSNPCEWRSYRYQNTPFVKSPRVLISCVLQDVQLTFTVVSISVDDASSSFRCKREACTAMVYCTAFQGMSTAACERVKLLAVGFC